MGAESWNTATRCGVPKREWLVTVEAGSSLLDNLHDLCGITDDCLSTYNRQKRKAKAQNPPFAENAKGWGTRKI